MEESSKSTIYLFISVIIFTLTLSLLFYVFYLQQQIASDINDKIVAGIEMMNYKKFDKYNNKLVTGDDIIEAYSLYGDELTIYVRNVNGTGINYKYTPTDTTKPTLSQLQQLYDQDHFYLAVLSYGQKVENITTAQTPKVRGAQVTGIVFIYQRVR